MSRFLNGFSILFNFRASELRNSDARKLKIILKTFKNRTNRSQIEQGMIKNIYISTLCCKEQFARSQLTSRDVMEL